MAWLGLGLGEFGSQLGQAKEIADQWRMRNEQLKLEQARQRMEQSLLPLRQAEIAEIQQRLQAAKQPQIRFVDLQGGGKGYVTVDPATGKVGPLVTLQQGMPKFTDVKIATDGSLRGYNELTGQVERLPGSKPGDYPVSGAGQKWQTTYDPDGNLRRAIFDDKGAVDVWGGLAPEHKVLRTMTDASGNTWQVAEPSTIAKPGPVNMTQNGQQIWNDFKAAQQGGATSTRWPATVNNMLQQPGAAGAPGAAAPPATTAPPLHFDIRPGDLPKTTTPILKAAPPAPPGPSAAAPTPTLVPPVPGATLKSLSKAPSTDQLAATAQNVTTHRLPLTEVPASWRGPLLDYMTKNGIPLPAQIPAATLDKLSIRDAALDNTIDILKNVQKGLPLLRSPRSASLVRMAISTGLFAGMASRAAGLFQSNEEYNDVVQMAGNLRSLQEHINILRSPLGATGFRGQEGWIALQSQIPQPFGLPGVNEQVLNNTLNVLTKLRDKTERIINGTNTEDFPPPGGGTAAPPGVTLMSPEEFLKNFPAPAPKGTP